MGFVGEGIDELEGDFDMEVDADVDVDVGVGVGGVDVVGVGVELEAVEVVTCIVCAVDVLSVEIVVVGVVVEVVFSVEIVAVGLELEITVYWGVAGGIVVITFGGAWDAVLFVFTCVFAGWVEFSELDFILSHEHPFFTNSDWQMKQHGPIWR